MSDHSTQDLWAGYLDDTLNPEDRSVVVRHLQACPECRSLLSDLEDCEAALVSEAAVLGKELGIPEERAKLLAANAASVLLHEIAGAAAARRSLTVHEGARILQSVFEPVYGAAIVERVFQLAGTGLNEHSWPEFSANLDNTASEIWGGAAGRALRRISAHLPIERWLQT